MDAKRLFPIGSVVRLKEAEKELMVIGILPINEEKQYDYLAVLYPEGYINDKYVFLFNHDDIVEVKYLGYMDSSYQMFRSGLNAMLENKESGTQNGD